MSDLKARPSQSGTRKTCPRCQFGLKVPSAEEAATAAAKRRPGYEYETAAENAPPAADQTYIWMTCPVCLTRLDAQLDQVGSEIVCHDCGTPTVVTQQRMPPGGEQTSRIWPVGEEYPLWVEGSEPGAESPVVNETLVPVTCGRCGTLMHATEDQVGQKITCPDCSKRELVRPPEHKFKAGQRFQPLDMTDEYGLSEGVDQPDQASLPGGGRFVKIVCSFCGTHLPATADQAGREIVCVDCGNTMVVPEEDRKSGNTSVNDPIDQTDEYGVGAPIELGGYRHLEGDRRLNDEDRARPGAEAIATGLGLGEQDDLSDGNEASENWTFFSGVFNFLFYLGVWPRWAALSLVAAVILFALAFAVQLAAPSYSGWGGAIPLVAALAIVAVSVTATALWGIPASAICLIVLQETSEGNDRIENWLDPVFVDWVFDGLVMLAALLYSMAVASAVAQILMAAGLPGWTLVPVVVVLAFPFLLLSVLETGSIWNPFSGKVCRSVSAAWSTWVLFYMETIVLVTAAVVVACLAMSFAGLSGVALAAPVLVAATLLYFRLLGRLAYISSLKILDEEEKKKTVQAEL